MRIFLVIFSVYLYCPLFIQCPSVRPSRLAVSVLLFSFLLFPPAKFLRAPAVAVVVAVAAIAVVVIVVVFVAGVLLWATTRCAGLFVRLRRS